MLEKLYPHIYLIRIPLPKNPLKVLNSYIVVSPDRSLIIDTGFNQPECQETLFNGIAELGLDLTKTDVLLTHRHSDHTGQASQLEKQGARIYAGDLEAVAIQSMANPASWTGMNELVTMYGLQKYDISTNDHPGYKFRSEPISHITVLAEGELLKYGDYTFSVVNIPGHTPGHIGLYEEKYRLFFGGDHILGSITPNITFWNFEQDSLAQYFSSLRKIREMEIDWVFTAHREMVLNHKGRIDELLGHHEKRLAEIMNILPDGRKSACEVASHMTWEIKAKSWEEFPKPQKWFATGESAAHLEYLYNTGRIGRETVSGTMYYGLNE